MICFSITSVDIAMSFNDSAKPTTEDYLRKDLITYTFDNFIFSSILYKYCYLHEN